MQKEDINKIRVSKLKELIKQAGGIAPFCKTHLKYDDEKPINATFLSQIINGHRNFGEKAARNLEKKAGLRNNYFDSDEEDDLFSILGIDKSDMDLEMIEIIRIAAKIKKENRSEAKKMLRELIDNTKQKLREEQ